MTVSIAKVRGGKKSYYESELEVTPESYYLRERISQNKFVGEGAELWGISEQIISADNHAFHALFRGEHPQTDEPLIRGRNTERVYQQEQGSATHKAVRAYDLTFSPPKSVSIIEALSWAAGDTQTARQVWQSHERAVRATLHHVEKQLLFTRTGAGGSHRERVDSVCALIHHNTSRPVSIDRHPDPQLHTHALLFNAGVLPGGQTGAIDAWPLFRAHHRLGEIYHHRLQQELHQELGFSFRQVKLKKGWSFEIEGVPRTLIGEFSQRRREIEQKLTGSESSKQVRKEVLATRKPKAEGLDRAALLASWQETARKYDFDVQAFVHSRAQKQVEKRETPSQKRVAASVPPHSQTTVHVETQQPVEPRPMLRHRAPLAGDGRFSSVVSRRLLHLPKPSTPKQPAVSQKTKRLQRKFLWLYATGKISRSTYLRVVEGRGLPTSRFGIDVAYATYRISQAQRLYLYHKHGLGLPKGAPTTKVSINLAYATRQITAGQRLYLLHRQKRSQVQFATLHKPEMKRVLKKMVKQKVSGRSPEESRVRPSILKKLAIHPFKTQTLQPQQNRHRRPRP